VLPKATEIFIFSHFIMPNQYRCLIDYNTVDKSVSLARSLDVDSVAIDRALSLLTFRELRSEFTEVELNETVIDLINMHSYEQILMRRARRDISRLVDSDGVKKDIKTWFVTVNFDDSILTDDVETLLIQKALDKLRSAKKFQIDNFVVEKYREGGSDIHRHIHMKVQFDGYKSKLAQFVFESIPRTKEKLKLVKAQNFIDVDPFLPRHDRYIAGDKTDIKLKCVEMDRKWRIQKNIPEFA
jgi:hypothetical protein